MKDLKSLKNKITEFSDVVKSIDNNNETVISVTIKAQDCDIVSIPVEEKTFREMFLEAIANNCDPQTFNFIGMKILMDDEMFQRYVAFKTIHTDGDLESKWILEAINVEVSKANQISVSQPQKETIMTNAQTTQAPELTAEELQEITRAERKAYMDALKAERISLATKNGKEQAVKEDTEEKKVSKETKPVSASVPVPSSEGFDWTGAAKTAGIFVGGAAIGTAGKWAWDHFFG